MRAMSKALCLAAQGLPETWSGLCKAAKARPFTVWLKPSSFGPDPGARKRPEPAWLCSLMLAFPVGGQAGAGFYLW